MIGRFTRSVWLVALVVVAAIVPQAGSVRAGQDINLDAPYAFSTTASGLMPAIKEDRNVAIARLDFEATGPKEDPVAGLPGFVIVIEGSVMISADSAGSVAILEMGDAIWLVDGEKYQFTVLNEQASIWRVAIGPDVTGRQIGSTDAYTLTFGDLTDIAIPDGAVRQYVVRTAMLPQITPAVMGGDDEKIVYAFSLAGEVTLTDEDNTIEAGHYVSPFLSSETDIEAVDGAAMVGYIAQGPIVSPDPAGTD